MKKITYLITAIYSIICCVSCSKENDELDIYSELINGNKFDGNIVVIDSTTIGFDTYGPFEFSYFKKQLGGLELETFNDFISKNETPSMIQKNLKTDKNIIFMSNVELDNIFKDNEDGWQTLRKQYGKYFKVLEFSKVGFNKR